VHQSNISRKYLSFLIGSIFALVILVLADLLTRVYLVYRDLELIEIQHVYRPDAIREHEERLGEFGILPPTPLQYVEERVALFNWRPFSGREYSESSTERLSITPLFARPIGIVQAKLKVGGKVIFDVSYTMDNFGRRIIPGENNKNNVERFLILLGDSHIFGEGIEDNETLSYFLGKNNPSVRVYNYGIRGLIPGQTLDWLKIIKGPPEISEKRGTVLYFWADYLIHRNMLTLAEASWSSRRPYYFEREDGEIVAEKRICDAWPTWSLLAKAYSKSALLRFFGFNWPKDPKAEDYEFMAKLIAQLKREAIRLGADQFYVVFRPLYSDLRFKVIPFLEKAGIHYIDYGDLPLWNMVKGNAQIPFDNHMTGEANEAFAREISRLRFLFEDSRESY